MNCTTCAAHRDAEKMRTAMSLCVFTSALALMAFAAGVHNETPSREMYVALSNSVVRVEANREDGAFSVGSGVTVAPSVVVTNCHVIRDANVVRISGLGRLWEATDQYVDTLHDLCFLRVPTWRGDSIVLGAAESLRVGQPVAALGFTGGTAISLKMGHVLALHSMEAGHIVESDTAFTSGSSGGGLFDASGALVGLLTFRARGKGSGFYSLPVEWIRDRLPMDNQWSALYAIHGERPFWQRDADALPYFMRVSLLETEGRWDAVLDLTDRWSSAFPDNAEPLLSRGKALQNLEHPRAAVLAFSDALRLAPDEPAAWYGLAIAYASLGDNPGLRRAQAKVGMLDENLAAKLEVELGLRNFR